MNCRSRRCGFIRTLLPHAQKRADESAPTKGKSSGASSALQSGMRSRQGGYTLIEVIVAFAVLALALTLLLGTLSGAARQVRWSADAGRAALHAQSLLDQTGVGEYLEPGRSTGQFEGGRYRWTLDITPYADPSKPDSGIVEPGAARLLHLALSVEWGDAGPRQRLRLQSLRLSAPDPTQATLP